MTSRCPASPSAPPVFRPSPFVGMVQNLLYMASHATFSVLPTDAVLVLTTRAGTREQPAPPAARERGHAGPHPAPTHLPSPVTPPHSVAQWTPGGLPAEDGIFCINTHVTGGHCMSRDNLAAAVPTPGKPAQPVRPPVPRGRREG